FDKQIGQRLQASAAATVVISSHRGRRIGSKSPWEDSEPAKHCLLIGLQQIITPAQRCIECLVAWKGCATTSRKQRETVMEPRADLSQAELIDSSSSQFDRQRYAIELTADSDDNRRVGVAELEPVETGSRGLDEKLDRRKRQRLRGCEAFDHGRKRQ